MWLIRRVGERRSGFPSVRLQPDLRSSAYGLYLELSTETLTATHPAGNDSHPANLLSRRALYRKSTHARACASLRFFRPAASSARYSFVSRPNSQATGAASRPSYCTDNRARVPPAIGSTEWRAVAMMPGLWVTQVNCRPGSNSVTMKSAGLSFGCRTCARAPIASGPGSSRVTLVMLVVHSCHRSTSLITAHTADGGTCTSTLMLKSFTGTLHAGRVPRQSSFRNDFARFDDSIRRRLRALIVRRAA